MRAGDIRRKGRVPSAPLRALCARICSGQIPRAKTNSKLAWRIFKPGRELLLILHLRISNIDSVSGITYHAWPKLPLVLTILVRGQFSSLSAGGAIYNAKPSHTCADTRRIQRVAHSLRIALASVTRWRQAPDMKSITSVRWTGSKTITRVGEFHARNTSLASDKSSPDQSSTDSVA
jgi:hypothetical protein